MLMIGLSKVLVVDQSKSSRETLCSVVSAHCEEVIEAEAIGPASELIESAAGLSLVLCEDSLSDGDPGDLLMTLGTIEGAGRWGEQEARAWWEHHRGIRKRPAHTDGVSVNAR